MNSTNRINLLPHTINILTFYAQANCRNCLLILNPDEGESSKCSHADIKFHSAKSRFFFQFLLCERKTKWSWNLMRLQFTHWQNSQLINFQSQRERAVIRMQYECGARTSLHLRPHIVDPMPCHCQTIKFLLAINFDAHSILVFVKRYAFHHTVYCALSSCRTQAVKCRICDGTHITCVRMLMIVHV